ncbi:hypothetical protein ACUNWD_13675 [Sunxiuqinia sp. A32]|uniref:hypothetical protein n=1 Tax=Sunxiuqinia sp. A32 TaxID=3461496 RepID=UPI004045B5EC
MNPIKAFLFLLFVIATFLSILYLNEYRSSEPIVSEVIVNKEELVDTITKLPIIEKNISEKIQDTDSIVELESTIEPEQEEKNLFNPQPFIYSPNDSIKFDYLKNKLNNAADQKLPVRILYFGDSQIENDRITSGLRRELQLRYGGKGLGFISLEQLYNSSHQLMLELSNDWTLKSFQDKDYLNPSLLFKNGILKEDEKSGWFRIKRIQSLHPKADYELIKIYYLNTGNCQLNITSSKENVYDGSLPEEDGIGVLDVNFNRTPENIKLTFTNETELNILGISLESKNGVLVDNIALRGLSYPTFEWSDTTYIEQMMEQLNPGLFVFHFGVNLVPYDSEDYFYFKKYFKRQILFLKENYPLVPILIVGVSDMAKKQNGLFKSYSNIEQIKSIQKQVALETNSIFWDLEAFMGGPGGMVNWVSANPELGRKDYTHFSKEGAEIIGEELSSMIIKECANDSITVQ